MARAKGLHVHPIKDGVFSIITKGFATDAQIFGKPSQRYGKYIKTKASVGTCYRSLCAAEIEKGVYLVLEKVDIFGIEPTYQVTELGDRGETITTYNIYKQN